MSENIFFIILIFFFFVFFFFEIVVKVSTTIINMYMYILSKIILHMCFNQQYFANRQIIYLKLEKVCSLVWRMLMYIIKKHACRKCFVLKHMHSLVEAVYLNFMKQKLLSNLYFTRLYFLLTSNKNQRWLTMHVSCKKKVKATKKKNGGGDFPTISLIFQIFDWSTCTMFT